MKRVLVVGVVLSLAANVALVFALSQRSRQHAGTAEHADVSGEVEHSRSEAAIGDASNAASPAVVNASDLPALVSAMRAAGFPKAVVRGIISAALNEQFAAQRRAMRDANPLPPFWKPRRIDWESSAASAALWREQKNRMRELLGPDAISDEERRSQRSRYGNLPDEKLDALSQLETDYNELSARTRADIMGSEGSSTEMPWEREQLAAIDREKRRDLEAMLTPDELRQYDLRNSRARLILMSRIQLFDASEQEYTTLYDLFSPAYTNMGVGTLTTIRADGITVSGAGGPAVTITNDSIKAALGEARYADYERAMDRGYRTAYFLAQRLGLPSENAAAVYDLQKSAKAATDVIRQNHDQTPEQRTEALASLARASNEKLVELLGSQGAEAYKSAGGSWLQSLERSAHPPPKRASNPGGG